MLPLVFLGVSISVAVFGSGLIAIVVSGAFIASSGLGWAFSIDVEQSQVSPSSARLQSHLELPAASTIVGARASKIIKIKRGFKCLMT